MLKKQPVFDLPALFTQQGGIEKAFARLFSTDDGKRVLSHLQAITFMRAQGPDASFDHLRHAEGQRALMVTILRLIAAGK